MKLLFLKVKVALYLLGLFMLVEVYYAVVDLTWHIRLHDVRYLRSRLTVRTVQLFFEGTLLLKVLFTNSSFVNAS